MSEPEADTTAEPSVDGAALTGVSPAVSAAGDSVVPLALEPVSQAAAQQAPESEHGTMQDRRWLKNLGLWASGVASAVLAGVLITTFQFFLEQSAKEAVEPPTAERLGCETGSSNQADGEQYLAIQLSQAEENCWQTALEGVNPGDEFDVLIWWRNWTGEQVDNTTIRAYLADGLEFVPGTATWHNSKYPDGLSPQVTVTRGQLSTSPAGHSAGVTVANITTAAADTTIFVTGVSGTANFLVDDYILIGSEIMRVTAVNNGVSFNVTRNALGTTPAAAYLSPSTIFNLSANTASIYFSFFGNSTSGAACNGTQGVGCAVKLTQIGLR